VQRSQAPDVLPVSVVVPTIGRAELLGQCLQSISECNPRAAEIVIVDQSGDDAVRSVVTGYAPSNARLLVSTERDRSLAVNRGMREAEHDFGLITDDDCTVAPSWVGIAWRHLSSDPRTIVTGRVLPVGDAVSIPSLVGSAAPHDYTGEIHYDVLFGCNMACSRERFLAQGGFDERVKLAEDNDFCYRWLMSGQAVRYEPRMVVWHRDWRSPDELRRLYRRYWSAQGEMYAKHLSRRDLRLVPSLVANLRSGVIGAARRRFGRNRHVLTAPDFSYGALTHLPLGLLRGLRSRPVPPSESGTPAA
jgi:GT2 family glycosyltransferase